MAIKNMIGRMTQRIDTASNWKTHNPVLLAGEIGIESDTKLVKIGDGTSNWNSLPYINNFGQNANGIMTASTTTEVDNLKASGAAFIIDVT